jgi:hypothetical protein
VKETHFSSTVYLPEWYGFFREVIVVKSFKINKPMRLVNLEKFEKRKLKVSMAKQRG